MRMTTLPAPLKGALHSLQRGGDGSAPHMRRILWRRGQLPVSICSHISSLVGFAIGPLRLPTALGSADAPASAPAGTAPAAVLHRAARGGGAARGARG